MKEKYCKIPKFRFNKFIESWERLKYEDVIEVNSGKDYKHLDKGDIPVYGTGGYMLSVSEAITNKDGVGIGRKGTINKPYILKAPYWTVDTLFFCIPKDKYNLYFINAIFERTQWERFDESTGVPSLSKLTINNIQNYFPSFDEQSVIGSLFRTLDDLLASYKDNLANYQSLKATMLSKIFPKAGQTVPEIRLDGFEGDWRIVKLGDVLSELKSGLSRELSNDDIGLPVIRANNISDGNLNLERDIKYWFKEDPKGANTANYFVKENDILVNFINSEAKMGTAAIVSREPDRETIYTTNILKLTLKGDYYPYFIYLMTFVQSYQNYIKSITKPAVNQASFTTVDFKKYEFLCPAFQEQQAIGAYFSNLDNLITSHQEKISQLETLKKKLLQDMFI